MRVQVRWVLAHGGAPQGLLPAAWALGWPRGRAEPFGGNSIPGQGYKLIAVLVTQGRTAMQAGLIVSRNYGDIVPPKITYKG